MEQEKNDKIAEENRVRDLKEKCQRKGLNYEEEEKKYQQKLAEKKRREEEKRAKKLKKK